MLTFNLKTTFFTVKTSNEVYCCRIYFVNSQLHSKRPYNKQNITRFARRYGFYVLVARTISHSFAALTREILFLPLEHKIHIFSQPCNILYIPLSKQQTALNRLTLILKYIVHSTTCSQGKPCFISVSKRLNMKPFEVDKITLEDKVKLKYLTFVNRYNVCCIILCTLCLGRVDQAVQVFAFQVSKALPFSGRFFGVFGHFPTFFNIKYCLYFVF